MIEIFIDGSSRGNPGDSGIGVMFVKEGHAFKNISRFIGHQTNNFAEYSALICALQEALVLKVDSIKVFSDSQLLCRQINGEYKVKNENIKHLYEQCKTLIKGFRSFTIEHIPRENNKGADKLARSAKKEDSPK